MVVFIFIRYDSFFKNEAELNALNSRELEKQVKEVRLLEQFGKHGFQLDAYELFEPLTKSVKRIPVRNYFVSLLPQLNHG